MVKGYLVKGVMVNITFSSLERVGDGHHDCGGGVSVDVRVL